MQENSKDLISVLWRGADILPLTIDLDAYKGALNDEIKSYCHYVIEPELTYTSFADLFTDIDLYSNRLGKGDQKQSDTIASLLKEISIKLLRKVGI